MPTLKELREQGKMPPLARKPFTFDRKTRKGDVVPCEVMIQILTGKEHDEARASALRHVNKLIADEGEKDGQTRDDLTHDARIFEALQYALRDPAHEGDADAPPWATAMELREMFTPDELGIIWKAYRDHESAISPFKHELTKEEFEAMVIVAATNKNIDPQEYYGSRLRIHVHHLMAKELLSARAHVEELEARVKALDLEAQARAAAELEDALVIGEELPPGGESSGDVG